MHLKGDKCFPFESPNLHPFPINIQCHFLMVVRRWGLYLVNSHYFHLCGPVLHCLCCLLLLLTYICFQRPHLALCCSVLELAYCSYYCWQTVVIQLLSWAHSKFIKIKRVVALLCCHTSYKVDFIYLTCNTSGFRKGAAWLPSSKP